MSDRNVSEQVWLICSQTPTWEIRQISSLSSASLLYWTMLGQGPLCKKTLTKMTRLYLVETITHWIKYSATKMSDQLDDNCKPPAGKSDNQGKSEPKTRGVEKPIGTALVLRSDPFTNKFLAFIETTRRFTNALPLLETSQQENILVLRGNVIPPAGRECQMKLERLSARQILKQSTTFLWETRALWVANSGALTYNSVY